MLRPIIDSDTAILTQWIARDKEHTSKGMQADFFRQPDTIAFAIDDSAGPILYVRIDPLNAHMVRLHIQFDETQRMRTARALWRNFGQVQELIAKTGVRYILFDSASESLIRFCQKRFGFVHYPDTNEYFLDLKAA